ncbi:MAG: hypothetical protein M3Z96_10240 [Pseudomonadota bacterium]|nr:hypothetical protein [Pseudomonadota bacterium]
MLVPHRRENAEFGERGCAPDEFQNARIFVRLQAMRGNEFLCDLWFVFKDDVTFPLVPFVPFVARA